MTPQLQAIFEKIEQSGALSDAEKEFYRKKIKEIDGNESLLQFKVDRIEKDRRTLSVMLEESIEDLEKKSRAIEAQNKELGIEAALERVRSVAMGMKKPEDMLDICRIISEQLELLHVTDIRNVQTAIFDETKHIYLNYEYYRKHNKTFITEVDYTQHPVQLAFANQMLKGEGSFFSTCLEGDKLNEFVEHQKVSPQFVDRFLFESASLTWYWTSLGVIAFGVSTYSQLNEESQEIVKRFRNVFDLSYRRYLDIEKAEAQAREAQIEAALERVRSRTMAMQKSDELAETAAVLFKQLILLGIEPNRLYINIIKDETGEAEFWITDEDGSKVSSAFTANMNDNATFQKMYKGWKEQKDSITIDMHGKELEEYFRYLGKIHVPFKGGLLQKRRVQHIAYFAKGFIGIAAPEEQPPETIQLLERFAYVFNLTFTRFNDLKIAEAHAWQAEQDLIEIKIAKKKAEDTLTELQAAQKQLIQSEKMASLGELTAGIAHEIQNPLNFVNNFSEVSKELIEEMVEEVNKGNKAEIKTIAGDLVQNLEKINYHGQRAAGIVKGMLQHSRGSSGQKEPTDINALCDEYLRLAYHGLRAKDKSFNAKFETHFDSSIGKVNVMPQEIGRVILNLINNAFYAASQNPPLGGRGAEPTIWVRTKKLGDNVQISVRDNGQGIPQNIIDKIFQPFFTTKPAGQGTGLGLSLAYDIMKAHGGEIRVETKEGEGSEFILTIPMNH